MKENYVPWQVNIEDFYSQPNEAERLKFLIRFAVLAPSSHNSQPWAFKLHENKIFVLADRARSLPVSDANDRQLHLSLGCALENIVVAADYYGLSSAVSYFASGDVLAEISINEASKHSGKDDHLIFSIPKRHTNRNPYFGQVSESFLASIKKTSDPNLDVRTVSTPEEKNAVANIVIEALGEAMGNAGFRKELSGYLISNISKSKIGMPGFGLGMPMIVSFLAPRLIRRINIFKLTKKKEEKLLKDQTPVFCIVSTKEDTSISWIKAGQVCERVSLVAEKEGLKTAVLAAAIEVGDYYKNLQKILGTPFRPQIFMRIGYCDLVTSHSPRTNAGAVIKSN